jgi:hypothetical protein
MIFIYGIFSCALSAMRFAAGNYCLKKSQAALVSALLGDTF